MKRSFAGWLWAAFVSLGLAGCGSVPLPGDPPQPQAQAAEERAAVHAATMIGVPYRLGGTSPATGFDCSGLVHFSFGKAGVEVPRVTHELRAVSKRVPLASLKPGDLVFFHLEGKAYSHVGIYLADGAFVHAPSTGKTVRTDRLDAPYWRRHFAEVRRLL